MISRTPLTAVIFLSCVASAMAQQGASPEPYNDADAYQIYSVLLPHEAAYGDVMVILAETAGPLQGRSGFPIGPENCLYPEAASRFRDAVADYNRVNQKTWLLQRKFQLEKPYEIVNSDTIKLLTDGWNWAGFHKRYPSSGGILEMSAVGFNKDKTRAIVYSGVSCGGLCGSWRFHLLEKMASGWKEVRGVSCHTVS